MLEGILYFRSLLSVMYDLYVESTKRSRQDELTEEERQLLTIETIVQERKRLQETKLLPRFISDADKR